MLGARYTVLLHVLQSTRGPPQTYSKFAHMEARRNAGWRASHTFVGACALLGLETQLFHGAYDAVRERFRGAVEGLATSAIRPGNLVACQLKVVRWGTSHAESMACGEFARIRMTFLQLGARSARASASLAIASQPLRALRARDASHQAAAVNDRDR